MLQLRLLLFLSIVLLSKKSVFAFPHLSARQFDSFLNIDWGKAGAGLFTGLGALGTYLMNIGDQPPDQQDTTTTTTPKDVTIPGPAPPGPLISEPDYELGTPPQQPKEPTWEPSAPLSQCDGNNIFSDDCGKVLDQLIFTTGCAKIYKGQVPTEIAITQNGAIWDKLNAMAPGRVQTSTSSHCGIFMFTAPLTKDQSRQIAGMPGVSRVSSNIFFDASGGGLVNDPQLEPGVIEPAYKRRQLKKRDIVRQENAPAHLQFISTAENYRGISTDYVYDSEGGADTVVFFIGSGVTMNHQEFINKPITHDDFIFADDVQPDSTLRAGGFGTCMGSLVMGTRYGVSKQTKLKPVRTQANVASLIKAMVKISNYVRDQPSNGYVMLMDMAWRDTEPTTTEGFEILFGLLLYHYDVVTVVAGGTDTSETNGPINSYPALYAASTPLIAVGAVDLSGERYSWSRGGSRGGSQEGSREVELTVTAPGSVVCASDKDGSANPDIVLGTGIAAAQAAGLAAYFLSLYPHLRADQNPTRGAAAAVKDFIVTNAWARAPGGDKSIWNLMGPGTVDPSGDSPLPNSPY
ncbi:hypothetical protein MMC29_004567 [Sticta canariensis]|nr:hypothetical protein [Sticta canariensis]